MRMDAAFQNLKATLAKGVKADGRRLFARGAAPGRDAREEDLEVFRGNGRESRVLLMKLFQDGGGLYPWAELYTIFEGFHGSEAEEALLSLVAVDLPPGGAVHVEYEGDPETREGLLAGYPPPATRLGALLLYLGFTWFKDWYFAEGFREGGRKLQAEKALDEEARLRHLSSIRRELDGFLAEASQGERTERLSRAAGRAREILLGTRESVE